MSPSPRFYENKKMKKKIYEFRGQESRSAATAHINPNLLQVVHGELLIFT